MTIDTERYDVVVLGSGAAGLTAALAAHGHGASVVVLEKAEQLGGTSAWSGGMIWIPNNPLMQQAGISDSRDEALTYLRALSHDLIPDELAQSYVDHGPEMVSWLMDNTPVKFVTVDEFPDYHPEFPGGKTQGGRSLECPLMSFNELGEHAQRVTVGSNYGTAPVTMAESNLGRAVPVAVSGEEMQRRRAQDMRGKTFAFVDKATTAGYLLPLVYFKENGINDYPTFLKETYFAGTHEDAIYDVLNRKAEITAAIGRVRENATRYARLRALVLANHAGLAGARPLLVLGRQGLRPVSLSARSLPLGRPDRRGGPRL